MKSLLVIHNYFKKGPNEVIQNSPEENPSEMLKYISTYWSNILDQKTNS